MEHLQERLKKYFKERQEREEREKNSQSEATKLEKVGSSILDLLEALPDTILGFLLFKNIKGTFTIRPFVYEESDDGFLAGDADYKKCQNIEKAVANIPKAKQSMEALNYIEYEEEILSQIKDMILKAKNPKEIRLNVNGLYVMF